MGCKQSNLRGHDDLDRPKVPADSWYSQPLTELCLLPMTAFHDSNRGAIVYSTRPIPTSRRELDLLPGGQPVVLGNTERVHLTRSNLYAMAYLHNTALFTEHMWRTRVPHGHPNKFSRPFYDTLMTVKVIIDGQLVPDAAPHEYSVAGCTTTLNTPDALARWKHVPMVLLPDPTHYTFRVIRLYDGLIRSFAMAVSRLPVGEHELLLEVSFGCHNEDDFKSGYLAFGTSTVVVDDDTVARMVEILSSVPSSGSVAPPRYVPSDYPDNEERCGSCGQRLVHYCTTCGASVCGSRDCVFTERRGYPVACEAHPPPEATT